jgi:hypothetical protein
MKCLGITSFSIAAFLRRSFAVTWLLVLPGPRVAWAEANQQTGDLWHGASMVSVDYAALVSKADLDRNAPLGPNNERGLPIGNGRMGTLLWTAPDQSKLHLEINHTDVFAFRSSSAAPLGDHDFYCNGCGDIDIDVGENVFTDASTKNHLGIYDALAEVQGKDVHARAFVWNTKDVVAVEITDNRGDPKPITVDLRMLRKPVVVSGPHTATSSISIVGQDIELTQAFREKADQPLALDLNSFTAMRIRVLGRPSVPSQTNDQTIRLTVPAGKGTVVVLISLEQSKEDTFDAVKESARASLDAAAKSGMDGMLRDNKTFWHDFWSKSFISMSGSPQIEEMSRFYTWGLYIANSSMRGNFPAKFNGSIFTNSGDKRDWGNNYWWYNQSAEHGWEYAANHGELLEPVLRWNWRNFNAYANAAQRSWNSRGWWVPETSSWDGPEILPEGVHIPQGRRQRYLSVLDGGWTSRNTYDTSKFAALYYRKYLYTLDENWLRSRVYPVAKATAEFYCGLKAGCQYAGGQDYGKDGTVILKKDGDGKYHLYGTELHEHIWWGKDIIEDLAGMRGVFPLAIALSKKYRVDTDERAEWQDMLDNLAPYPRDGMPDALYGLGPGTWAKALSPHGLVRGNEGPESPRMGPVRGDFDVLTLESNDPQEWAAAMATLDHHPGTLKKLEYDCGYHPIVAARMGRADLVEVLLPQQMLNSVEGEGSRTPEAMSFTTQGLGIFAQAAQAALLLSISPSPVEEPVIRVMEAWPRKWDVSFELQAQGGFLVRSAMKGGTIPFVEIYSQLGGRCYIRNPWPGSEITLSQGGRVLMKTKDSLLKFPTEKGKRYLLASSMLTSLNIRPSMTANYLPK